ncbi:oxidized purine nucleoside triphosphate hydrolase-like [Sycon ciliatum]|uniref:oxidized purine nucleoside triphosphate hydrolase-like n=1 Tax=Sycon ciliatum TaxID=27933 RepID=UPI0031F66D3A
MGNNKIYTLVFVVEDGKVLLGMKKRGFGVGRWNGFGGKVEPQETIMEGAKRELEEESLVKAEQIEAVGVILFEFVGEPVIMEVHVFRVDSYTSQPEETEEMRPQWFPLAEVPYDGMWPDDIFWLPSVLAERKHINGYFLFEGMNTILKQDFTLTSPSASA